MRQPLVALSASSKSASTAAKYARVRLNEAYVRAVQQAGITPLVVPPSLSAEEARDVMARVDGLLLTGGEDVDPSRYGAERHPATQKSHAFRDATEIALVNAARDRRLPVFAICRGLQLLNVALGGTLVQDLGIQRPSELLHAHELARRERVHDVSITANSRLSHAVGDGVIRVNTLHHQAVDRVAPTLRVTARASDDVIEAAETMDPDWWVLGVQWHPEELIDTTEPWDRALFAAFASACRA